MQKNVHQQNKNANKSLSLELKTLFACKANSVLFLRGAILAVEQKQPPPMPL
jgi:hypothetical protein